MKFDHITPSLTAMRQRKNTLPQTAVLVDTQPFSMDWRWWCSPTKAKAPLTWTFRGQTMIYRTAAMQMKVLVLQRDYHVYCRGSAAAVSSVHITHGAHFEGTKRATKKLPCQLWHGDYWRIVKFLGLQLLWKLSSVSSGQDSLSWVSWHWSETVRYNH